MTLKQAHPTVLIIDKNSQRVSWLKKELQSVFILYKATSCADALQTLHETPIDLILLDEEAPGLSKLTFCKQLSRGRGKSPSVLLMTKKQSMKFIHNALQSGVCDLIPKPLNRFNLRKSLHLALNYQTKTLSMGHRMTDLKKIAHYDALTGLANRHSLLEQGAKEIAKAKRPGPGHQLSLLLIDIDHYKRVNGLWGHLVGDSILVEFAHLLSDNLRQDDIVARYGGEEFVVLLPQTNLKDAEIVGEKLCRQIANHSFFNGQSYFHLTVSIGISQLHKKQHGLEELIKEADLALFTAKRNGRNRVISYKATMDASK